MLKVLPCLVVRGPAATANVIPNMAVFQEVVNNGLKCLTNGCNACTATCLVARELSDPERVKCMFDPSENAPNLDDFENSQCAFATIALDSCGNICTLQVSLDFQAIVKNGFYSTQKGGLSIAANPEVAECLVNSIKHQISPVCMLKHLFADEDKCRSPMGGICMNACGSIAAVALNGVMPWAAGKATGQLWYGYEGGRFSIFNCPKCMRDF